MEKKKMTTFEAKLLRDRMRYKRNHFCLFPQYVVLDRTKIRKFKLSQHLLPYLKSKLKLPTW
jgi:hypothetical protein